MHFTKVSGSHQLDARRGGEKDSGRKMARTPVCVRSRAFASARDVCAVRRAVNVRMSLRVRRVSECASERASESVAVVASQE